MTNLMDKFLKVQEGTYDIALNEIKEGQKISHWMWFIFPQIQGLGFSWMAMEYEIPDFKSAKEYLNNEILRDRLLEISEAVYNLDSNVDYIFGYPDDLKFKSCMTLFALTEPKYEIFRKNLDKFYNGEMCEHTMKLYIEEMQNN